MANLKYAPLERRRPFKRWNIAASLVMEVPMEKPTDTIHYIKPVYSTGDTLGGKPQTSDKENRTFNFSIVISGPSILSKD